MVRLRKRKEHRIRFPIAPMIDCVFLLMVYFMLATTWNDQELDLTFQLPGVVEQTKPLTMPDNPIIELTSEGQVIVNSFAYDMPESPRLTKLTAMLSRLKQSSDANRTETRLTIAPANGTAHQAIVKVLDAAQAAGIENVNFSLNGDTRLDVAPD